MEHVPEYICKLCGSSFPPQDVYQVWNHKHSCTCQNNKQLYYAVLIKFVLDLFVIEIQAEKFYIRNKV